MEVPEVCEMCARGTGREGTAWPLFKYLAPTVLKYYYTHLFSQFCRTYFNSPISVKTYFITLANKADMLTTAACLDIYDGFPDEIFPKKINI